MEDKKRTITIDKTLTPQNAYEKGYAYIDDVIYDTRLPGTAIREVVELVTTFNCKLGTPTHGNGRDPYFGLYIPKK